MNELPSATFRKTYAKLTEATVVTVNGHPIGQWIPGGHVWVTTNAHDTPEQIQAAGWEKLPGGGVQARQAQRDALLGKINRGK